MLQRVDQVPRVPLTLSGIETSMNHITRNAVSICLESSKFLKLKIFKTCSLTYC